MAIHYERWEMARVIWLAIILSGCASNKSLPVIGEVVDEPIGFSEMCIRSPSLKICNE